MESASPRTAEALRGEAGTVERLAKVSDLTVLDPGGDGPGHDRVGAHAVLPDGSGVFVPLGDAIDVAKECARLSGEMERLDKQIGAVSAKLANDKFVQRAPEDVVAREREKERAWSEKRDTLAAKLASLGC